MNLFDILKEILVEKKGDLYDHPEFDKAFNVWMIARYLSMRESLLPFAQFINQFGSTLSKKNLYLFLVKIIPKQRSSFIRYMKKKKED